MTEHVDTDDYNIDYIKRYTSRPWYRKKLRKLELLPAILHTCGKTIDFGCGTGDLLDVLPEGSVGLDINPHAIDYCKQQGLDAIIYDSYSDDFGLTPLKQRTLRFESLAMCHFAEHLPNVDTLLPLIFSSAKELGVYRIVITVPGLKGYNRDETHQTFVSPAYIQKHKLDSVSGFKLIKETFHPLPFEWMGNLLSESTYVMIYDSRA